MLTILHCERKEKQKRPPKGLQKTSRKFDGYRQSLRWSYKFQAKLSTLLSWKIRERFSIFQLIFFFSFTFSFSF